MTRVIAGTVGGHRLRVPHSDRVRPTSDRVKEAMFSTLGDVEGAVVLDLFAGSGGLGIEALSRGAARAVFVEQDRRTLTVLRGNLVGTGLGSRAVVIPGSAERFAAAPSGGPFDLVFLDPPYAMAMPSIVPSLEALHAAGALAPGVRVVFEREKRSEDPTPAFLSRVQDRTYGETVLRYYTLSLDPPRPSAAMTGAAR